MLVRRLAFAALLNGVVAQVGVGVPGVYNSLYGGSHLCNRSFAEANLVRGQQYSLFAIELTRILGSADRHRHIQS
jgi:hypothetical protein